jgi:hypothetical protein
MLWFAKNQKNTDTLRIHGKSAKYIYVDVTTILQFYGYKTNITVFLEFQKYRLVGVITGFVPDSITTISCIGRQ